MKRLVVLAILFVLILASCAPKAATGSGKIGSISVSEAWARQAMAMGAMGEGGTNGAAYMVIENSGDTPDRLVKAESDISAAVELHQSVMEGEVMKMSPVDGVDIPAKGKAELKQGGYHVMFLGIKQNLKPGEKVHLKLTFEKAGVLELDAVIRAP